MDELPMVVTALIKFDGTKAKDVRNQLRAALGRRSVVIADLTQTRMCDLAAIGELFLAHDQATHSGRELRIVVSSAALMREFVLAGLNAELRTYLSVSLASRSYPEASSGHLAWAASGRRGRLASNVSLLAQGTGVTGVLSSGAGG